MIAIQGFHCDISIYTYIVSRFGSFPPLFSLFLYSPLLKMTLTGFSVPCPYMYRKYINIIHPPLHPSFTLPSCYYSPLNMTCFTFLFFIV
jgi:hypothetical protein